MPVLLRRILVVVPILAASTVLAATLCSRTVDDEALLLFGLRFVLAVSLPLLVINRWLRLGVALRRATAAGLLISLSFPVLFYATPFVAACFPSPAALPPPKLFGTEIDWLIATMITSALGARFVAIALRTLTRRHDPILRWAMVAWGGCWPLLLFTSPWSRKPLGILTWLVSPHDPWLGPVSILAWQAPIGLACTIWFLRSAPGTKSRLPGETPS